jgi:transcriptional regulator with XRE-family HTH domain
MATRPSALTIAIAAEIRGRMAKKRVSQNELADAMTRSQSYVSRRLMAEPDHPFDVDDLAAAAQLLGTTMFAIVSAAEQEMRGGDELSDRRGRLASPSTAHPAAAYPSDDGIPPTATEDDFTT